MTRFNHHWPRVKQWTLRLAGFGFVQATVQAVGLVSGILLVRTLTKTDYAYFTLANTMQGTMSLLADVGISSGLSAIGGRVWHDRFRFGQLINTALHLRRSLLVFSMLVISPILLWMLLSNGATLGYAGIITATVLIGLSFQVTSGVLVVIPRLHLQIGRLQKLDMLMAVFRLGLILVAYLILLNTATAVLATIITFAVQYYVLKRWSRQTVDTTAPINMEDRTALWAIVRKQAPNDIYFCFQGQIMIWLISIFGSTKNIAEIGALGRLAVIFTIINTTMTSVILPRFARCQSAKLLKVRYLQILGCFVLFGLGMVLLAILFPIQLLYILGPKYMHLKAEVVLMVLSAAVGGVNGAIWSCNYSKGWIPASWIAISTGLATQVALLFVFDISTVRGVLLINIFALCSGIAINAWVATCELRRLQS
jgi:O-antigen/teichoic acid export membrane protein